MAPGLELHPDTRTNLSVLIIGKPLAWIRGLAGFSSGVEMGKVPFDLRQSVC
jgi:hypothetical protein